MRSEVEHVLEDIFFGTWHIDMGLGSNLRDEKLLGSKVNMEARDLVVLLFSLEERLGIHIENTSIANGMFDTFEHIMELIYSTLS